MRPVLRSAGPLSCLAASLLPVLGASAIHSTVHGLLALAPVVVTLAAAVSGWGAALRRAALGVLAAGTVGLSTWLYGGRDLDVAAGAVLRVLYLVLPAAVLTSYIDPARLGDHLGQRLHLPARAVVAGTAALQQLESLGDQWDQVRRARRARGVGAEGSLAQRVRATAAMTFTLLVSTLRRSSAMSLAMDARGFASAGRRTWAEAAPWRGADTLVLAWGAAMAAWPWVVAVFG